MLRLFGIPQVCVCKPPEMATRSVLCSAAVALAVALLFTTAEGYHMSIKNNLQDRLRIHCWSDRQNLATTFVAPRNYYAFDFPTEKQSSWSCNFSGPGSYSGTFVMWTNRAIPCFSAYSCPWVVDDYGLSLIRHDGYVQHVYHWP